MATMLSCNSEKNTEPNPFWDKKFRISCVNRGTSIQPTIDENIIFAGATDNAGWVMKLNNFGTILWQKKYCGITDNHKFRINSIQQTTDEGFIVAGAAIDNSIGDHGDIWYAKLNSDGIPLWQKTGGGSGAEEIISIHQTTDNGYIMGGYTSSFGAGFQDFWIMKATADGNPVWQKTFGGFEYEAVLDIQPTSDNGCIAVGHTGSFNVEIYDFWVVKLNSDGSIGWQKSFGDGG